MTNTVSQRWLELWTYGGAVGNLVIIGTLLSRRDYNFIILTLYLWKDSDNRCPGQKIDAVSISCTIFACLTREYRLGLLSCRVGAASGIVRKSVCESVASVSLFVRCVFVPTVEDWNSTLPLASLKDVKTRSLCEIHGLNNRFIVYLFMKLSINIYYWILLISPLLTCWYWLNLIFGRQISSNKFVSSYYII